MLKGRGTKCFGVVFTWYLDILAIFNGGGGGGGGGRTTFSLNERGAQRVLPCLEVGGGHNKFQTRDFPIL